MRPLRRWLLAGALWAAAAHAGPAEQSPLQLELARLAQVGASVEQAVAASGKGPVAAALAAMCQPRAPGAAWALRQLDGIERDRSLQLAGDAIDASTLDPDLVAAACNILSAAKQASAGPRLVQLTDRSFPPGVRLAAIAALGPLGGSFGGTLIDLLKADAVPGVRVAAAQALGGQGLAEHASALAEAFDRDPVVDVRAAAALALGQVKGETAWGALLRHLEAHVNAPDAATLSAGRALAAFGARALPEMGKLLKKAKDDALTGEIMAEVCPSRESAPLPKFANAENSIELALAGSQRYIAGSHDALLRGELLDVALFYTSRVGLVPDSPEPAPRALQDALKTALLDGKRQIRATAYSLIPQVFKADALALLSRGLTDPDQLTRIGSAVGVEAMGDGAAARKTLETEWSGIEPDDPKRGEVLSAGGQMRGPREGLQRLAVDAFQTTISYPVLVGAAELLRSVPHGALVPGAMEAVRRAAQSDDPQAKALAAELLGALEKAPAPPARR